MGNIFINKNADYSASNLGKISLIDESTYDEDGLIYANAVGLTGAKRISNDTFFKGLKTTGIWPKINRMWGLYGTTWNQVSLNMKTPGTNALTWVSSSPGLTLNNGLDFSVTQPLVKTGIILTPAAESNCYFAVFNSTPEDTAAIRVMMGATVKAGMDGMYLSKSVSSAQQAYLGGATAPNFSPWNSGVGMMAVSRTGTSVKGYDKGVKKTEFTQPAALGVTEMGLGCWINDGTTLNGASRAKINFCVYANYLTDAEHSNLNALAVKWLLDMGLISQSVYNASI